MTYAQVKKSWLTIATQKDRKKLYFFQCAMIVIAVTFTSVCLITELMFQNNALLVVIPGLVACGYFYWLISKYRLMWVDVWPAKIKAALQICKVPYSKDFVVKRIDSESFEINFGGFPIKYKGNIKPKEEALRNVLEKYVTINKYGVSSAVITLSDAEYDDWIPAPEEKKPKKDPVINMEW